MVSLPICDSLKKLHNFQFLMSRRWFILRVSYPWMYGFFKYQGAMVILHFVQKVKVLPIWFQQNQIYDKFPNFFPNGEESSLMHLGVLYKGTVLYFPLLLWRSFCFEKTECQLSILKVASGANLTTLQPRENQCWCPTAVYLSPAACCRWHRSASQRCTCLWLCALGSFSKVG